MSTQTPINDKIAPKDLSLIALFSLIFGSMMGSGVFDIPQNVGHAAGVIAVLISWGITTIGMLSLGWAFVYITRCRPDIQSGIYGYARYGFGSYVGFNAAWGYWLSALLGNASYLVYIFASLGNFAVFKFLGQGNTFFALISESVLIWIVYILISRGIREASLVNILITTVKFLALMVVVILFIYGFHWSQFKVNFTPELHLGSLMTQIKSTMLVTVWDFIGIEAACIYALRARNMQDVAIATTLGVIVVLVIDALISILPFGIISSSAISKLMTPSTASVLVIISGNLSAELVRLAVVISVIGALLAWMMLATNVLYVAAEDRTLPKFLMQLNERNVPRNSLLTSSIILQAFIIIAYFTQSVYLAMIQLATSLILVPYLLSALFAFKLFITDKKVEFIILLKGVLAVIYAIWLIYAGGLKYLAFASILYLAGMLFYVMARLEEKEPVFTSIFEKAIFTILIILAILSVYFWLRGNLSLY